MTLPVNIDSTYADSGTDASVKAHQQHHDTIHAFVNAGIPVGVPVVRAVSFAFDTPGLVAGYTVHTPTVGDVLIDAWIEVLTAWDGTTPTADIGTFEGTDSGLFDYNVSGAAGVDLTQPDGDFNGTGYSFNGDGSPSLAQSYFPGALQWWEVPAIDSVPSVSQQLVRSGPITDVPFARTPRMGMGRFIGTNPFKVVVSDSGRTSGNDPGATQGSAILYLVTVTPLTS